MHHHRHRHGQRHCLSPSLSLSCYVRMAPYWGAHNRKLYIIVPQDTNKVSTMPVAETKHSEKERTFRRRKRQQKKSDCSTFYQLEVCGVWHKVTVDTPFLLPWNNNNKKKKQYYWKIYEFNQNIVRVILLDFIEQFCCPLGFCFCFLLCVCPSFLVIPKWVSTIRWDIYWTLRAYISLFVFMLPNRTKHVFCQA